MLGHGRLGSAAERRRLGCAHEQLPSLEVRRLLGSEDYDEDPLERGRAQVRSVATMKRGGLESRLVIAGMCLAGLLVTAPMASGRASSHDALRGKTSRGKPLQVQLDKRHRLTSLTLTVAAKCGDKGKRSFLVTFSGDEIRQDATGDVAGLLNEFVGSFFGGGGPSYREHESFSARVTTHDVAGTARATRTFDSGSVCRTGTIRFDVNF
jgi:hypothetical protein